MKDTVRFVVGELWTTGPGLGSIVDEFPPIDPFSSLISHIPNGFRDFAAISFLFCCFVDTEHFLSKTKPEKPPMETTYERRS